MRVGVLRLRRSTVLLALPVVAATALLASFATGNPPQTYPGGGIFPVPGQGPPGAVAAFGAMIPRAIPQQAAPFPAPAPLVAAKFLTPAGVRVTAFPGTKLSKMYDAPVVMGLRPGYVYRFELANLPYSPGKALYPEVEVRGMLVPRPGMKYMDHPIPLSFTSRDIERALSGALVTKVIYLEDPAKAVPAEVQPDKPVETPEESGRDAIKNALDNGRLMAIVRLGDRRPSAELLQTMAIEGTILCPANEAEPPLLPPVFQYWACRCSIPSSGRKDRRRSASRTATTGTILSASARTSGSAD